jgi:hypothetical protein
MSFQITISTGTAAESFAELLAAAASLVRGMPPVESAPTKSQAKRLAVQKEQVADLSVAAVLSFPASISLPDEEPAKLITLEGVRAYLAPHMLDQATAPAVRALLTEFGIDRLSSIPADKLQSLYARAQEVLQ